MSEYKIEVDPNGALIRANDDGSHSACTVKSDVSQLKDLKPKTMDAIKSNCAVLVTLE